MTTDSSKATAMARPWRGYASERPETAGPYEWLVPSRKCEGLTVHVLAHYRKRGAGSRDVLSPEFDHWNGYKVTVPEGTQWREAPEGTELKQYRQDLLGIEGLTFSRCMYCGQVPKLHGVCRLPDGGVIVTSDAHEFTSWWLECCAWGKTPHLNDPRKLEERRAPHAAFDAMKEALVEEVSSIVAIAAKLARGNGLAEDTPGEVRDWLSGEAIKLRNMANKIRAALRLASGEEQGPVICEECGIYPADLPSKICPGCDAYREHTGQI